MAVELAIISGIALVTGTVKWALAKAWPGVFAKSHQRVGRHRSRAGH
jgi:hypothetical protein